MIRTKATLPTAKQPAHEVGCDAQRPYVLAKAETKRGRGRPTSQNPLQHVSLRLEPAVIQRFKDTGPGWQARINDALKAAKLP